MYVVIMVLIIPGNFQLNISTTHQKYFQHLTLHFKYLLQRENFFNVFQKHILFNFLYLKIFSTKFGMKAFAKILITTLN